MGVECWRWLNWKRRRRVGISSSLYTRWWTTLVPCWSASFPPVDRPVRVLGRRLLCVCYGFFPFPIVGHEREPAEPLEIETILDLQLYYWDGIMCVGTLLIEGRVGHLKAIRSLDLKDEHVKQCPNTEDFQVSWPQTDTLDAHPLNATLDLRFIIRVVPLEKFKSRLSHIGSIFRLESISYRNGAINFDIWKLSGSLASQIMSTCTPMSLERDKEHDQFSPKYTQPFTLEEATELSVTILSTGKFFLLYLCTMGWMAIKYDHETCRAGWVFTNKTWITSWSTRSLAC